MHMHSCVRSGVVGIRRWCPGVHWGCSGDQATPFCWTSRCGMYRRPHRLLLRRCGCGNAHASEETSLQKRRYNTPLHALHNPTKPSPVMADKMDHSHYRHESCSGLVVRSHPLGAGAQEAEERGVEVEVLGVELLQLLNSNVDNLRGRPRKERKRCRPHVKNIAHAYIPHFTFFALALCRHLLRPSKTTTHRPRPVHGVDFLCMCLCDQRLRVCVYRGQTSSGVKQHRSEKRQVM